MKQWQLQEAKAKLSNLVKCAQNDGPQKITVNNKDAVIVISAKEYSKLVSSKKSLVSFLRDSPIFNSNLNLERDKSPLRDLEL